MRRVDRNDMRGNGTVWRLPCLLLALAAAGAAVAQQAQPPATEASRSGAPSATTYRVVNLGAGPLSTLPKINAKGQVVFSLNTGAGSRGYFYNGSVVQDIGTLGGSETLALDLNNAGQVAGGSRLAAGNEHAFIWSTGAGMLDLGALGGAGDSRAEAINNRGVVAGTSVPGFEVRAFRWSATAGMEDLGAFTSGAGSFSAAAALNDAGLIAGNSDTLEGDRHAFAWTRSGGLADIDTLGSSYALPVAVGAKGQVAGFRLAPGSFLYQAFLWTPAGSMLDLGTAGGTESFAIAMSPEAHIAGLINTLDGNQRAMSWTRATGMRNLGTLGGRTSRALELNSNGQLVGYAYNKAQASRAFVWTARTGLIDLNTRLRHAPPGLVLDDALAINDSGAIVASSNAGLVLLKPATHGHGGGHVLGPVTGPELAKAGAPVQASVSFIDEDRVGTRGVVWSWGDGSGRQAGRVSASNGAGSASASHSYAAPGIYPVTATVLDRSGRSTAVSRTVVVTSSSGGTLAGAGAVMSPHGAFKKAPLLSGKATFSLIAPVSATARAAGIPARFQFDLPGLSLRSDNLRFLGQQAAQRVFVGSGTIRGKDKVEFRIATSVGTAAGAPARFGIRIWRADAATGAEVVEYDNLGNASELTDSHVVEGAIVQD